MPAWRGGGDTCWAEAGPWPVGVGKAAGVNQTHEEIADIDPVLALEEEESLWCGWAIFASRLCMGLGQERDGKSDPYRNPRPGSVVICLNMEQIRRFMSCPRTIPERKCLGLGQMCTLSALDCTRGDRTTSGLTD